jgi:hypothetical protein
LALTQVELGEHLCVETPRLNGQPVELPLLVALAQDIFLNGVGADQAVDVNLTRLADTMAAVLLGVGIHQRHQQHSSDQTMEGHLMCVADGSDPVRWVKETAQHSTAHAHIHLLAWGSFQCCQACTPNPTAMYLPP